MKYYNGEKTMKQIKTRLIDSIKSGFFKGVGLGAGLLSTGVFAAAMAMNVFAPGQVISSAMINQNFAIAAPEGAIMAFYLANCPDGWAPADGTNGTPNLRGMFIRGRDDVGTGPALVDPDGSRAIGALPQGDTFQGHWHSHSWSNGMPPNTGGLAFAGSAATASAFATDLIIGNPTDDGVNGAPRTANETRPKNVALTYCMRKN